jgi:hypothetical protein
MWPRMPAHLRARLQIARTKKLSLKRVLLKRAVTLKPLKTSIFMRDCC